VRQGVLRGPALLALALVATVAVLFAADQFSLIRMGGESVVVQGHAERLGEHPGTIRVSRLCHRLVTTLAL
jgi:hypothetical protein